MSSKNLVQCRLRKNHQAGYLETVAWIEERGATVGKRVQLVEKNNEWWDVYEVYAKMPAGIAHERSRDYKRTRKVSDVPRDGRRMKIILPKD